MGLLEISIRGRGGHRSQAPPRIRPILRWASARRCPASRLGPCESSSAREQNAIAGFPRARCSDSHRPRCDRRFRIFRIIRRSVREEMLHDILGIVRGDIRIHAVPLLVDTGRDAARTGLAHPLGHRYQTGRQLGRGDRHRLCAHLAEQ